MSIIAKYRLEITVFFCGACGMILELVGSRVVSPYFGNSLTVWTSLIGIILGSLSLGYYLGGKLADRNANTKLLSVLLIVASICVALTAFLKEIVLTVISIIFSNQINLASLLSIIILFAPASVILGIVSPYAAKLKLAELKSSGQVIGNLYAISTLGSIIGTFLAGFYLIPTFGNTTILYLISAILMLVSVLLYYFRQSPKIILILLAIYLLGEQFKLFKMVALADIDTQYGRIIIRDDTNEQGKKLRYLEADNGQESAIYVDDLSQLVFDYTKSYRLSNSFQPQINRALMIGGAAYTYPRDYLVHNPHSIIDVVEIDPQMTALAKKYFFLEDDSRLKIFHQDARMFVKTAIQKYDVIFLDAFLGITPPSHLTTKEFMSDINNLLTNNGVLLINLISATEGDNSSFFIAEANTLRTLFPRLDVYLTQTPNKLTRQNLLLVAYKSLTLPELTNTDPTLNNIFSHKISITSPLGRGQILTDDHAPIEFLTNL
jgi:spermidine synthase